VENFYTIAELAQMLKLSDVTIRRYIRLGEIETQKIGRQHRITETEVKRFLKKSMTKTKGDKSDERSSKIYSQRGST